ncbi:MAG: hypothetical protein ACJAV1_001442 [Paraglaciecola sp.]|jgi:hypothetical protein
MFLNILSNAEIITKYGFASEQDFASYVSWLKCGVSKIRGQAFDL